LEAGPSPPSDPLPPSSGSFATTAARKRDTVEDQWHVLVLVCGERRAASGCSGGGGGRSSRKVKAALAARLRGWSECWPAAQQREGAGGSGASACSGERREKKVGRVSVSQCNSWID
jgi:hypothetical protein